jgi:hypothetical protein
MTVLLPSATRRSRFLFEFDASRCLCASEQALDAVTGQAATFTRAATKVALDANGVASVIAHSLPAFEWTLDPVSGLMTPGVLLEGARTNVVLWSRDLTNAAWTKTNCTAAKTQLGVDGQAASASLLTATAGNGTCLQAITLASSARYQSAYVKRVTGSGVVNMTTDNGATWTAVTVTSSWSRVRIPSQTLANPTVGFRLVTSGDAIAVDYVQNETGLNASSPIPTTTVAVARAADSLSFPYLALPAAMTVYARYRELGTQAVSGGAFEVGALSPGPSLLSYRASATTAGASWHNGTTQQVTGAITGPVYGDQVEDRVTLSAAGSAGFGLTINGGVETSPAASPVAVIGTSPFGATTLTLNTYTGAPSVGFAAFYSLRIALGVQTLAYMRVG